MKIRPGFLYVVSVYGEQPTTKDILAALEDWNYLGFEEIELEGVNHRHLSLVYKNKERIKRKCEELNLRPANFVPMLYNLSSLNERKRTETLEDFKKGIELGTFFGCRSIEVDSFLPEVKFGNNTSKSNFSKVEIPPDFSWNKQWNSFVNILQKCTNMANDADLKLALHPRAYEIVSNTAACLNLFDKIKGEVGVVFDTTQLHFQKEILPLSLYKLKGKISYLHLSDGDGINPSHVPIMEGKINWERLFKVLAELDFDGDLVLDLENQGKEKSLKEAYIKSKATVESLWQEFVRK